ncbi:hypothetical protein [Lacticaseibacillus sp. N501-2]|uniref:hypothetical protein n=1 Tax=Lacticaseibacillus salsurae TaxID=3367729 RepID=UPI0038B2E959
MNAKSIKEKVSKEERALIAVQSVISVFFQSDILNKCWPFLKSMGNGYFFVGSQCILAKSLIYRLFAADQPHLQIRKSALDIMVPALF